MIRNWTRADAKLIAEAASTCADRALFWKERALAAEEALRKFAGEIYARDSDRRPEGIETAKTGSTEGESAVPQAIAQPLFPNPKDRT